MAAEKQVKHAGGCHCGKVRFEVMAPAVIHVYDCNCSICKKKQNKHFIVPKDHFTLLELTQCNSCGTESGNGGQFKREMGKENLTCYTFNTHAAKHLFCKTCGVQSFYVPRSNPDGYGVMPHCLDDGTVENIEVEACDGQNWEKFIAENPEIKERSKKKE